MKEKHTNMTKECDPSRIIFWGGLGVLRRRLNFYLFTHLQYPSNTGFTIPPDEPEEVSGERDV